MSEDVSQNPPSEESITASEPQSEAGAVLSRPAVPSSTPSGSSRWRRWLIPVSISIGCLPWSILFVLFIAAIIGAASGVERGKHVALIRVSGIIRTGGGGGGVFGDSVAGSDDLIEQLESARKNKNAKAIVLRIDSPGGSPAGSEEVYEEIMRVRKSGKPVYTSMADVAASGGYYIASACDKIYSDATTITGSIGVRFETTDMSALFKKIGFNPQTIKSGKYKDTGSPNRPLTPEERKLLQQIVNDTYTTFVQSVAEGRKMPVDQVKKIADGRILTGSQALKLKLVDKIGGLRDTVRAAARAGGIKGEPMVIAYRRTRWLESFLDSNSESFVVDRAVAREIARRLLRSDGSAEGLR